MIRFTSEEGRKAPAIDTLRGEFTASVAGELRRFDTRLSTVAAMEAACGERAIVEVLNGLIVGRRVADQIPLLAAALAATETCGQEPAALAARATVAEAEAFILALVFALGFTVAAGEGTRENPDPLGAARGGGNGAPSRSAA